MAGEAPQAPLFERLREANSALEKMEAIRKRYLTGEDAAPAEGELSDMTFDLDELKSIILTAINGSYDLPEQRVSVEYLKNEQKLMLPYALGMHPAPNSDGEVPKDQTLLNRYHRMASTTYAALRQMVDTNTPYPAVRTAIEALALPQQRGYIEAWNKPEYYARANGDIDGIEDAATTFTYISQALQFNCDIRDLGFLMLNELRLGDGAWKDIAAVEKARLSVKLKAYTMASIAALNLSAVGGYGLAAWVRSYGVGAGVLHVPSSASQKEYRYTKNHASVADRKAVREYERNKNFMIYPLAMNVIAMFGLFHLNKDHTYKSNDSEMLRICTSYVKTLRTIVDDDDVAELESNLEPLCRTAAHPFGLGQTYFVARVMGRFQALASPLAIRLDVTPPPVQRIMICHAAYHEWASVPVGCVLNELYKVHITAIEAEVAKIRANPPAYSSLHTLYAETTQAKPDPVAMARADSMMPIIYGFAMTQHTDENGKKDGLALAMSFHNVLRDRGVLSRSFEALWDKYSEQLDKDGLVDFAKEALTLEALGTSALPGVK